MFLGVKGAPTSFTPILFYDRFRPIPKARIIRHPTPSSQAFVKNTAPSRQHILPTNRRTYKLGKFNAPKNGKVRRVDMSDQLHATLQALLSQRKREALKAGLGEVVESVFHRDGKPIEQNYIRRVFKRALMKAGLREIRLHDIRHTFASLLLSDGQSPAYVKEQLGHHSIQMTVDVYGHLLPSSNRDAVNRLDSQPSATYPQPAQKQEAQPIEIAPHFHAYGAEGGI